MINPVCNLESHPCASRKGLMPEAKGEATLTETLSAEVGDAGRNWRTITDHNTTHLQPL